MKIRLSYLVASALLAVSLHAGFASRQVSGQSSETNRPEAKQVVERISEDSLRGHLSFIASDSLEGRATPSPGLDVAAEYIAAQFRRAGLEPAGDDGYFQTANWKLIEPDLDRFELTLTAGAKTTREAARRPHREDCGRSDSFEACPGDLYRRATCVDRECSIVQGRFQTTPQPGAGCWQSGSD